MHAPNRSFGLPTRRWLSAPATLGFFAYAVSAWAQSAAVSTPSSSIFSDGPYHEVESKYLFGFTDGSDIGEEGEKSIEFETTTAFQRRGGAYSSVEQEVEFESVPTQFSAYELSAHGLFQSSRGVAGVVDFNSVNFSGLSAKYSYLLLARGPESPIGLTLSAEPEWMRIDGTSGLGTTDFSSTFKIVADTELIPNRLLAAVNLSYAPDIAKLNGAPAWTRSSTWGVTSALAYRVTPKIALGGEVQYYRAYDSFGLAAYQGNAVFVGPTLNIQFTPKIMLAAAFSVQAAGRAAGEAYSLDLTNFQRYLGNLKLEIEF